MKAVFSYMNIMFFYVYRNFYHVIDIESPERDFICIWYNICKFVIIIVTVLQLLILFISYICDIFEFMQS